MPIGPARMPLFDHIGELRRRLTIIVVSLLVCAIVVYFATPALIELMMDQIREAMRGGDLYVFTALGGFTIRFQVALFFSVTMSFKGGPYVGLSRCPGRAARSPRGTT